MSCGVYKITNRINGKIYIGQSINIESRWNAEKWHGKTESSNSQAIIRAIRRYGLNSFDFEIVEETSVNQLDEREKYWITFFDSYNPTKGYNATFGGQNGHGGIKRPPETGQRISKALKGKSRPSMHGKPSGMSGKKHSEEVRQKMSKSGRGKHSNPRGKMPEDQKQKIREGWTDESRLAASERAKQQNHSGGWHHSDETKQKMSNAKKGKPATNKGIPRTKAQKELDRIIKLKTYLKRKRDCIKCTHRESSEIRYFVSANEAAIQLTGLTGAMTTVQKVINDPNWISPKPKSKAWQLLKDWKIEYCFQSELLEHRKELK
jgi:group I intron endonuclease